MLKLFEKQLAEYCCVSHVLCINSATAGLEIMLRWFGIGPGDEVIVPAFTWVSTANAVMYCNATPIFIDIDIRTFNMDVSQLKNKITSKTKNHKTIKGRYMLEFLIFLILLVLIFT